MYNMRIARKYPFMLFWQSLLVKEFYENLFNDKKKSKADSRNLKPDV